MTNLLQRIYDAANDVVTADVDNQSVSTDDTDTKRLSDDYHYAGAYDGVDADTRLDNAIPAAEIGDTILLENAAYNSDRTISKELRLEGSGATDASTDVNGAWTLSAEIDIVSVSFEDGPVTIDNSRCGMFHCFNFIAVPIDVNGNIFRYIGCRGGDITFTSGTERGIVDGCTDTAITDNGTNTVGDIA